MKFAVVAASLMSLALLTSADTHRSEPATDIDSTSGNIIELPNDSSNTPSTRPASQDEIANQLWEVVSVDEGDTMRVQNREGETITVRLACIDAPNIDQYPYGKKARQTLQAFLPVGMGVTLNPFDEDQYGRIVAEVFSHSFNMNLSMVQSGAAVVYRRYLGNCDAASYLEAEAFARQYRLEFWAQPVPVMPWDYR